MRHVKQFDGRERTVLMVQVENEPGVLGSGRDRSAQANRLFEAALPAKLVEYMRAHPDVLAPELKQTWNANGRSWRDAFGAHAPEAFTAWHYAVYMRQVAAAGKQEYPLPMFVNADCVPSRPRVRCFG
jgi:hypothetical protein